MQIYLTASPPEEADAGRRGLPLAHAAYRIGPDSRLVRREMLMQTRGGLLVLSDREAPEVTAPETLAGDILRECGRRSYTGAVLDFTGDALPDRRIFAEALARTLSRNRRALFLPAAYAGCVPGASVLLGTALSGGNYTDYLREMAGRYGAGRIALDVERTAMDFTLPQPSGLGTPLTREALETLRKERGPSVFFSQDLCARYFTCPRGGSVHFILYDDADTLTRKLQIAAALGVGSAFLTYPELNDLLDRMYPRKGGQ